MKPDQAEKDNDIKDTPKSENLLEQKLFDARTVMVFGEINQLLAEKIIARLTALSSVSDEDIRVIVCSQGGHVEAGDSVHDFIRFITPRVMMLGTGWVASAGAHIFLGAEKENRFCLPNTRFLLHQPMGGGRGPAADIDIEAREILKMRERLNKIIARETGQPLEKVTLDTDRNFWLPAEDAIKYGLVSRIVHSEKEIYQL